ncbi:unnamed protein product [Adineta steineri]|uniref:Uncharacterized protein n=1 Tax=Adineta steineri TaxID=433720 RepID=A0A813ZMC9_9BILA|nr:unnamed protein product [Adineta steineri]CAF1210098.1 unnamed protein product [Adineta steineri]
MMMAEQSKSGARNKNKNKVDVEPDSNRITPRTKVKSDVFMLKREPIHDTSATTVAPTTTTYAPRTTQSEPFDGFNQIREGRREASKGNYIEAIAKFNEISPVTFDSLYYRGCAYLQLGGFFQIKNAIEDFNQALKLSESIPKDVNIYYKRAFACQLIGRYSEAIIDSSMFIEYSPSNKHKGYLSRGLVHTELQEYDKALEDMRQANEMNLQLDMYYMYCLARAHAALHNTSEAQREFKELADYCRNELSQPRHTYDNHFYYGIASYELNDYSVALQEFIEALNYANKQQQANTKFYIGLTRYALGTIDDAIKDLEDVLKLDADHKRAHFRLGMMKSENENSYSQALSHLTQAHKLTPQKSSILYERGNLHHKMGQLDACVYDKRLAFKLEQTNVDQSINGNPYELLLQRLLSKWRQNDIPRDIYLMLALLHDKVHTLSQETRKFNVSKKEYHETIEWCERGIDKEVEENGNYSPFYFALLCNLHNNHKHAKAAMTSLDNVYDDLEKNPEHEEKWQKMLTDIRVKKKEHIPLSEILQGIIKEMANGDNTGVQISEELNNNNLMSMLADRLTILENIEKNRNQVKVDREHFSKDRNTNRRIFYEKMRVILSHTFTAMCVTTEVGGGPIVKHDRTGAESLIADGVGLVESVLGVALPTGGEVAGGVASVVSSSLRNHEYKRYEERISLITNVGTVEELSDVSRQVARELADRYKEQLLSLTIIPHHRCRICSWCCRCFRKDQKNQPSTNDNSKEAKPAEEIAKFGIASIVRAILHGDIAEAKEYNYIGPNDLVHILVAVTCRAKPGKTSKVYKKLKLEKEVILLHAQLDDSKQGETPTEWNLHSFYRKPGIQLIDNTEATTRLESLTWMEPGLYGYRLGTQKEYDYLANLDKEKINNKDKNCCC